MIKDTVRGGDVVVTGILTDNDKRHCERRGRAPYTQSSDCTQLNRR